MAKTDSTEAPHVSALHVFAICWREGIVRFVDHNDRHFEVTLRDLWRNEELLARVTPADAFRLGQEFQRHVDRVRLQ